MGIVSGLSLIKWFPTKSASFFVQVLEIRQTSNDFDSIHETRSGGDCPGRNSFACINDQDTDQHSWWNTQNSTERVYFIVDGKGTEKGNITIEWTIRNSSCAAVTDLAAEVSPIQSTTAGEPNAFTPPNPCDDNADREQPPPWPPIFNSNAPEKIFSADVPPNFVFWARQTTNNFDAIQVLRWGGACPGDNAVACSNDRPDFLGRHVWINDQTTTERAFFIVDGSWTRSGDFTIEWELKASTPQGTSLDVQC